MKAGKSLKKKAFSRGKNCFFKSALSLLSFLLLLLVASADVQAQSCNPDLTTPSITCAKPDTFYVVPGECGINVALSLTAPVCSDNCSSAGLILSNSLHGPPYSIGATTFYWTVKDAQGNSGACAARIIVMDSTSGCPDISGNGFSE